MNHRPISSLIWNRAEKSLHVNLQKVACILYVFFAVLSTSVGNTSVKFARLFLFAVMFLMMIKSGLTIKKKLRPYIVWTLAFLGYAAIGCIFAWNQSYAMSYTESLAYVIICDILIAIYIAMHMEFIPILIKTIIFAASLKALYLYGTNGILVFLTSRGTDDTSANTIGYYCAIATILAIYIFKTERKKIYVLLAALNIVFLLLSASRKALLYLAIPIAIVMIFRSKNPIIMIRNLVLIIVAVACGLFLLYNVDALYQLIGYRVEGMINGVLGTGGDVDSSTSYRLRMITYGLEWFKERPFFGYGLLNYLALWAEHVSSIKAYYAHNNYIELLVDCGIVGTAIYYSLHAGIIVKALRFRKKLSEMQTVFAGIVIAIVICDYGMVSYYSVFNHLILLLAAVVFLIKSEGGEKE